MTRSRTIEIVAPSGYPPDEAAVERGTARLREQGHRVLGAQAAQRRHLRFAGADDERAGDLNRLADPAHPLPDIVLALRGGYGAVRLLDSLDYAGLARRLAGAPVAICGHSDFTAIQLALFARAGLVTFGGPMLTANFGAETLSAFTVEHFWQAIESPEFTVRESVPQASEVAVSGTLWGGNLAMIAALVGTPYMPRIDGGILFIEDVNEALPRIDRLLSELAAAGKFDDLNGVLVGNFTRILGVSMDDAQAQGMLYPLILDQFRGRGIPILAGWPSGHGDPNLTLPLGAQVSLDTSRGALRLEQAVVT